MPAGKKKPAAVPKDNKEEKKKDPKEEQDDELNNMMASMKISDDTPLTSTDIKGVAKYILDGHAKNIIVMTGAGISVNAGIPDFRSPGTGLYYNLQKYHLKDPQDVFSIDYFRKDPKPFYCVAKGIYPGQFHPTKAHYFIKLLAQHGLLLRNFTQNIDTLELIAQIPQDKVIYSHGSFAKSHCVGCHKEYTYEYVRDKIFANEVVHCECGACIKPDIVFFGENLPEEFFVHRKEDFPKCDLLIVMGTSLVVHPFADLISYVGKDVPRLLINKEVVRCKPAPSGSGKKSKSFDSSDFEFNDPKNHRDALYQGDIDDGIQELVDALGWGKDLKEMYEAPVDFDVLKFKGSE